MLLIPSYHTFQPDYTFQTIPYVTIFVITFPEILGAPMSVLIIWILTGVLLYMAVDRLVHPDYDIDADAMIIVSVIGVVMNIA